jgi:DnaJ-class molecular chaperone
MKIFAELAIEIVIGWPFVLLGCRLIDMIERKAKTFCTKCLGKGYRGRITWKGYRRWQCPRCEGSGQVPLRNT